jgi:rhomboid protease GluP
MSEELKPEVQDFVGALQRLPARTPVTYALVAINVAVFAAMAASGAGIFEPNGEVHVKWGSNLVPVTVDGEWWRLGTSMFLHFGLVHLLVNMWVLYANGRMVERMFGSGRYLMLYLFAGLTGSLASAAWHPATNSAGASGAIFGVLGGMMAFLVAKKSRVPREVLRAQGRSIAAFAMYNIVFGFTYPGIDNAAHLGGAVGGFLMGLALARPLTVEARAEIRVLYLAGVVLVSAFLLYASADAVLYLKGRMSPEDRFVAGTVWFDYNEPRVLQRYNSLVKEGQGGGQDDGRFADSLARDVIPFYALAKERLAWEGKGDTESDQRRSRIERYVALRLESMTELERGLRDRDPKRMYDAMDLLHQADAMANELSAPARYPARP